MFHQNILQHFLVLYGWLDLWRIRLEVNYFIRNNLNFFTFYSQMPTHWLFNKSCYKASPRSLPDVLFVKVHWISGYHLLCAQKEKQSDHFFAPVPSQCNASWDLLWNEICGRRTWDLFWILELFRPHRHVQLLFTGGSRTNISKVLVVEEIFNGDCDKINLEQ